jgi:hypothetical protein
MLVCFWSMGLVGQVGRGGVLVHQEHVWGVLGGWTGGSPRSQAEICWSLFPVPSQVSYTYELGGGGSAGGGC